QHSFRFEIGLQLVVDDLRLVLGADAGEVLLLRLGDAELVPGVLDVGRQVLPRLGLLLGGLDVVVDVVEVDAGEISSPGRQRPGEEVVERPMAHLPHPSRLVLVLRDRLDDLVRNPAARLEEVVAGLIRVREPVLGLVVGADPLDDLSLSLCNHNHHFPSTPNSIRPALRAASNNGPKNRSVPKRKSPASRTLFASVPHLGRLASRVDAVGPRPASWHAGAVPPSYSKRTR